MTSSGRTSRKISTIWEITLAGFGLVERVWMVVVLGAEHAGISVIQETRFADARYSRGTSHLLLSNLGQVLGSSQAWIADLTNVAVGGAH